MALETVVCPPSTILIDRLHTARQELCAFAVGKAEGSGRSVMSLSRKSPFRMGFEVAKNRLDELIVGWDSHEARVL